MRQRMSQRWIFATTVFALVGSAASARSVLEERFAAVKALGAKPTPAGARLVDQIQGEMVLLDELSSTLVTTKNGRIEYLLGRLAPDRTAYEIKHLAQSPDGSVTRISFRSGAPINPVMAVKSYYGEGDEIVVRQTLKADGTGYLRTVADGYDFKSVDDKILRLQKTHREQSYTSKIDGHQAQVDREGQPSAKFRLAREDDFILQATPNDQGLEVIAYDHERKTFYRVQARLDDRKGTYVADESKRLDLGAAQVHDLGLLAESKTAPGRSAVKDDFELNGLNVTVKDDAASNASH